MEYWKKAAEIGRPEPTLWQKLTMPQKIAVVAVVAALMIAVNIF